MMCRTLYLKLGKEIMVKRKGCEEKNREKRDRRGEGTGEKRRR